MIADLDDNTRLVLLSAWVENTCADRSRLLQLSLRVSSIKSKIHRFDLQNIAQIARVPHEFIEENEAALAPLLSAMYAEGILLEGHSAVANERHRAIINWFESKSDEEKRRIPLFANQMNQTVLFTVPGLEKVKGVRSYCVPTRSAIAYINSELKRLGLLDAEYTLVKNRGSLIKNAYYDSEEVASLKQNSLFTPLVENADLVGYDTASPQMSLPIQGELTEESIKVWVKQTCSSRSSLLQVPMHGRKGLYIDLDRIAQGMRVPSQVLIKHVALFEPMMVALKAEKIAVEGHIGTACEYRRRLLNWYEGLTDQQIAELPTFGNAISWELCINQVPGLEKLRRMVSRLPLLKITLDEIHEDLTSRGRLDATYKAVKDRVKQVPVIAHASNSTEFEALRAITLTKLEHQVRANSEILFAPLRHLFAAASMEATSRSGQENYDFASSWMSAYLLESGFEGLEPLEQLVNCYTVVRFRKFLEEKVYKNELSPATCNTHLSCVRKALDYASEIEGLELKHILYAAPFENSRAGDTYRPYSPAERDRIFESAQSSIELINDMAQPYKISGVGEDPLDDHGLFIAGGVTLDNARWIFENKLDCKPIGSLNAKEGIYERRFVEIIKRTRAPLRQLYESWGCLYHRDTMVIAPYMVRLAQITGLNSDSLIGLDLDDFVESHPATRRPCLRYWKERSTGEKLLHLDLFNSEISWLTKKQGAEVKKVFEDVAYLTKDMRAKASPEVAAKLFIYEASSPKFFREVRSVAGGGDTLINKIFTDFARRMGLKFDDGSDLRLTSSRLRPSLVSSLIDSGVSLREIQVILGHKDIKTTIGYLDRLDFNKVSREKLDAALAKIYSVAMDELTVSPVESVAVDNNDHNFIFKTSLAACRNIFNPPEFIKKLKSYVPGRPCSLYNKCLACDNVIITKSHLPMLFALQRDYLHMMSVTRVMDTPYAGVIKENLSLLEAILTPNDAGFSEEELRDGERLAEFEETSVLVEGVGV